MKKNENLDFANIEINADGTAFSKDFNDIYYSSAGAIEQAKYVFINGNNLEDRWNSVTENGRNSQFGQFTILETGFGLANNFLVTCDVFYDCQISTKPKVLNFISFELYPLKLNTFKTLIQKFNHKYNFFVNCLIKNYPVLTSGIHKIEFHFLQQNKKYQINLYLVLGNISNFLAKIDIPLGVDAIFLDGFSPNKNPEMWSKENIFALKRISKKNTTLATWCVAGSLRESLINAEFDIQKISGFAQKKHMLIGKFKSQQPPKFTFDNRKIANNSMKIAVVIGAGMAGCMTAFQLAKYGWIVHLLDSNTEICSEASGNLAGLLHPMPSSDDNFLSQLTRMGYFSTLKLLDYAKSVNPNLLCKNSGILHLANNKELFIRQQKIIENNIFPLEHLQLLDYSEIEKIFQISLNKEILGGLYFQQAAFVSPKNLCQTLLNIYANNIIFNPNSAVEQIAYDEKNQQFSLKIIDKNFDILPSVVVLCTGAKNLTSIKFPQNLVENNYLPIKIARGQITILNNDLQKITLAKSSIPIIHKAGYIIPNIKNNTTLIGATFEVDNANKNLIFADNLTNIKNIQQFLTDFSPKNINENSINARANLRVLSADRLPICGQMVDFPKLLALKNKCKSPKLNAIPRINGLFYLNALSARGLIFSNLLAELLALQIQNFPSNLPKHLINAVDIGRFYV